MELPSDTHTAQRTERAAQEGARSCRAGSSRGIGGPGFLREPSIRRLSGLSRGQRTNYDFSEADKVGARSLEKIPSFICNFVMSPS